MSIGLGFIGLGLGVGTVMLFQFIVDLFKREFTDFRWYLICIGIMLLCFALAVVWS
ncbi:hypothetical protein P4518_01410 [Geobacillus thermodenitrificans]|uniref:hypothetical protein n=1 Tax=Geobacillus thermodenitrificans TaxID=33940 RepID=UPI002E1EF823|nr:hypothetical protein [Geobacillus thermodenitrificans]